MPSADQVPIKSPHSTMLGGIWVKTIADFRRDNGTAIVGTCRAFVLFCRDHGLFTARLVSKLNVEIVPFTARQAEIARKAFRRYGRGRHDADLNFGDCCAYALAKDESAPLLFKGDDFSKIDVAIAAY